jgi:hypothetical protein
MPIDFDQALTFVVQPCETTKPSTDRFNRKYNYPYVFLNDEPFTAEFKERTSAIASGKCTYGLVPEQQWREPSWIDAKRAALARSEMEKNKVIYGGSESYRRMCRSVVSNTKGGVFDPFNPSFDAPTDISLVSSLIIRC